MSQVGAQSTIWSCIRACSHRRRYGTPICLTSSMLYRRHESAQGFGEDPLQRAQTFEVPKKRMLERLWNEVPDGTLGRFTRMHLGLKLTGRNGDGHDET